jgi:hypothetical protein
VVVAGAGEGGDPGTAFGQWLPHVASAQEPGKQAKPGCCVLPWVMGTWAAGESGARGSLGRGAVCVQVCKSCSPMAASCGQHSGARGSRCDSTRGGGVAPCAGSVGLERG